MNWVMEEKAIDILGVHFNNLDYKTFLKQLFIRINNKEKTFVVTANPEIVMYANKHPRYLNTINKATFVSPDGAGIVLASKLLNTPIKERVPGFELMLGLLEFADRNHKRVYFLGGKDFVNEKVVEIVQKRWPNIVIAGSQHGYFDHADSKYMDQVREAKADIVLIALGYPNQEFWAEEYLKSVPYGLVMGVGGSFDVLSGTIKRAPEKVQKWNIEWLYRVVQDPKRYKRLFAIPDFIGQVFKEKRRKRNEKK